MNLLVVDRIVEKVCDVLDVKVYPCNWHYRNAVYMALSSIGIETVGDLPAYDTKLITDDAITKIAPIVLEALCENGFVSRERMLLK